jgi:hypothetical protein
MNLLLTPITSYEYMCQLVLNIQDGYLIKKYYNALST